MASPVPEVPVHEPEARRSGRPGGVEDRYRSLFLIGRGGMGSVEVALERSGAGGPGFERVVALKRLLPEQARDPRHKEMFLREARLAALLAHANVVHAFAFGELYGELFLAMEYVEGEPLSRVLARRNELRGSAAREGAAPGGLDAALVALVLADVCDGLHAAHELRDVGGNPLHVVHRDVSPQNVMIAYEGHVKLLDFGVAKFDTGGHETRTGEVKGKMAYMSPEQALGEKLDRRSDLFSVGAVLFECLAGRRMWGSGTDVDVMRRLALEDPPLLRDALPGVPAALAELQARLVAREPGDRPATAADVAKELRAFVVSEAAVDHGAVRALMRELFGDTSEAKKALLTEALELAAGPRAHSLRKSMVSGTVFERPTLLEPVMVSDAPPPPSKGPPSSWRRRRGSPLWMGAAVLAAIAVGAAAGVAAMNRGTGAGAGTSVGAGAGAGASTGAGAGAGTGASGSAATGLPPGAVSPDPSASPSAAPAASMRSPIPIRPRPPRPAPRTSATSKLPDVDPTPF